MSEAEPTPPASSVTTLLDDWSIEIDADHVNLGQDGLGVFDWSEEADNAPVALALMATSSTDSSNSKVPYCSKCSKSYKKLLENYQTERDNFQKARSEILGYQMSLESLEVILKTHEKNEYAWGDKYEQMEYDLKIRDLKLEEKQKELDQALKERDDFKVKLEKWTNASVLQNEVLNKQRYLSDKSCIGFGIESSSSMESDNSSGDETLTDSLYENFKREKAYKAVPPPTGTIIPPRANVSFTGIDELAIRNKVNNQEKTKSSQPEIDRNKVIIEDWVDSDDEETVLNSLEIQKKTVLNSENIETSFKNSPNHLIKDCNLHARNLKQTQNHKSKGTQDPRGTRPVWNNTNRGNPEEDLKDYAIIDMVALELASPEQTATVHHGLLPFLDTQTDCIQDTAQKMKLKRLKASIATMTRQTDAEQRRPTIKKLEVKQVEFKLGEDCWEIQVKRSKYC
ncbi:hypothetical protein Tco_0475302 [Tanacetum coccineum]